LTQINSESLHAESHPPDDDQALHARSGQGRCRPARGPKLIANWLLAELFGALNRAGRDLAHSPITPEKLGRLVELIEDGTISGRIAKDVFAEMFETGADPAAIVESRGMKQISDAGAIERIADQIIAANPIRSKSSRAIRKSLAGSSAR
jgi:aspartyl-tRNA(Asn)/glutamyl-tRNA(Gln) amidotransferase subunit B